MQTTTAKESKSKRGEERVENIKSTNKQQKRRRNVQTKIKNVFLLYL